MQPKELLAALDKHRGSFPTTLTAEAIARREELIPILLNVLEDVAKDPSRVIGNDDTMEHIFAMYLLASFREKRAYPLLVKIFSGPPDTPDAIAGDVATMDLAAILASVYDGDLSGIKHLIENEAGDEYVRSVAMDALVILVNEKILERDSVMDYFLQLFQRLDPTPGTQWDGLVEACIDLHPQEAFSEIRKAFDQKLVDPMFINWEEVKQVMAEDKEATLRKLSSRCHLIDDVEQSMNWMQCFKDESEIDDDDSDEAWLEEIKDVPLSTLLEWNEEAMPFVRTQPKVGRNELCPCGSGKKYKKCCIDKQN